MEDFINESIHIRPLSSIEVDKFNYKHMIGYLVDIEGVENKPDDPKKDVYDILKIRIYPEVSADHIEYSITSPFIIHFEKV